MCGDPLFVCLFCILSCDILRKIFVHDLQGHSCQARCSSIMQQGGITMLIWIVPTLIFAGVVLLIDFIMRRKKWGKNTKFEKIGLILTLVMSFPYIFCSIYGALFGIVGPRGTSSLMLALYEIVVLGGKGIVFVCLATTIASLVLRRLGKAAASNRMLLIGLLYCAVITGVSFLV